MRFNERSRPRPRRQEDYSNYTERDIDEGWPYDDADRDEGRPADRPYGDQEPPDPGRNPGMHPTDEAVPGSAAPADIGFRYPARYREDAIGARPRVRPPQRNHRGKGPRGYKRPDERIREDICDLLTEDAQIDPSDVEVTVSGGEVTLDGFVAERYEKRLAEDWAEDVPGVIHVQNNLRMGHHE